MSHVYLQSTHPRINGGFEKTFKVEWFGLKAEFVVHESADAWEIDHISVAEGDLDHVNEIVDTYMMHDFRFEADCKTH